MSLYPDLCAFLISFIISVVVAIWYVLISILFSASAIIGYIYVDAYRSYCYCTEHITRSVCGNELALVFQETVFASVSIRGLVVVSDSCINDSCPFHYLSCQYRSYLAFACFIESAYFSRYHSVVSEWRRYQGVLPHIRSVAAPEAKYLKLSLQLCFIPIV